MRVLGVTELFAEPGDCVSSPTCVDCWLKPYRFSSLISDLILAPKHMLSTDFATFRYFRHDRYFSSHFVFSSSLHFRGRTVLLRVIHHDDLDSTSSVERSISMENVRPCSTDRSSVCGRSIGRSKMFDRSIDRPNLVDRSIDRDRPCAVDRSAGSQAGMAYFAQQLVDTLVQKVADVVTTPKEHFFIYKPSC